MPRITNLSRNMMRYIVPALLLVFLIPVLWSFFPTEPQILQLYEPTSQTFGVGFDLGASYGTVAVSYPNGTIQSIAKVVGDAAYLEVMSRLSLQTSQHLHLPYQYGEGIADWPRRTLRDIRIQLGLPASRDVGILSKMIKKLHIAAETFIGEPVLVAKASIPDFAYALYSEDIYEAFDYLKLSYRQFRPWNNWRPMYSSNGAYGASDYRICSNYTKPDLCWKQPPRPPNDPVFGVPYILIVSYSYAYLEARIAFGIYPIVQQPGKYNSTLGYNSLQDAISEEAYWEEVRQSIRESMDPVNFRNVTQLLINGDAADIPKFRQVLNEVTDSMFKEELEVLDEHPVFAAARGVAIFVMEDIWRQNHGDIDTNIVQEL